MGSRKDRVIPLWVRRGGTAETNCDGPEAIYGPRSIESKVMRDLEQRIRQRAYQIWLDEGCPDGRENIHWEMAAELVAIENDEDRNFGPTSKSTKPAPADEQTKALHHKRIKRHEDYLRFWAAKAGINGGLQARLRKLRTKVKGKEAANERDKTDMTS